MSIYVVLYVFYVCMGVHNFGKWAYQQHRTAHMLLRIMVRTSPTDWLALGRQHLHLGVDSSACNCNYVLSVSVLHDDVLVPCVAGVLPWHPTCSNQEPLLMPSAALNFIAALAALLLLQHHSCLLRGAARAVVRGI
jgi:hypothetical protein